MSRLTHNNHDRDVTGMAYVYPVLTHRSKGLSIGTNPNNSGNWECLYCQVPELANKHCKVIYADYQTAIRDYLTPFFGRH